MSTADGACSIVFNGEVYDAPSHRKVLQGRGAEFRSRTDTEVLLRGLALDGPEFLNHIDGMYALAFWDGREGALLLARDRFGEKPLFTMEAPRGGLLFASEIPALIQLAGFTPEVDRDALRHFVEWGYPPVERSLFCGVRKVQPGTWEWHGKRRRSGALSPLMPNGEIDRVRDVKRAGALLREALRESVRDRLVADVPVGVFLSGGIDSAGIAALAVDLLPKSRKLNTYTVGYPGSATSELVPARRIADRLGTCHHEIIPNQQSLAALPFLSAAMGEPVGDPAALPTYFLSATARRTSTVLLTGEGADEVLFGYPRYLLHDLAEKSANKKLFHGVLSRVQASFIRRLQNVSARLEERDYLWKGLSPETWGLFHAENGERKRARAEPRNGESGASWSRADDVRRWLPENVLARVDRMTMAASIEARSPYLGREVARLGLHLPEPTLRGFPYGKLALRSALAPYLPWWKCWNIKRPFAVPLGAWLRGPLRSVVDDVFFGNRLLARGWFQREGLHAVGAAALRGQQQVMRLAWALLTLELWARAHLDGEIPVRPEHAGEGESALPATAASNGSRGRQLVLAIDFPPGIGGIQRYNQEIWGHGGLGDVCVVAPRFSGDTLFDRTFPGRVVRLPYWRGYLGSLTYLAAMAAETPRLLRGHTVIQVAHVALAPAILPQILCRAAPVVVWTYALELTSPRLASAISHLLRRADRVVVISEYTRQLTLDKGVLPGRIVKICPGGDDLQRAFPEPRPERFRKKAGVKSDEFLILSVGRLSPFNRYKGFDRAIEVVSTLERMGRSFIWLVVGDGGDLEMYGNTVKRAGLENRVRFLGGLDDASLADAYAACDLFCLLSREEVGARGVLAEGYGIVFVQAGSFGKPVVGLRRGGVPDAVMHGRTGILVDQDDDAVIAHQIGKLMDQPAERERLGRNGLRRALGEASWAAARGRVREMLDSL